MTLSVPKFIKTAFAFSGQKNNIPETTNNVTGAAGYNQGFSEINMLPEGAGGIPPDGKDFNGIFYEITSAIQYIQSGATFPYNQDFADAIGGYGVGAVVADASDQSIKYRSVVANNTNPPPSTGWVVDNLLQDATESVKGVAKIATSATAKDLTNDTDIITSKKLASVFGAFVIRNVSSSRAAGVTYTNTTKSLIFVNIQGNTSIAAGGASVDVNGFPVIGSSYPEIGRSVAVSALIPVGATYRVPTGQFNVIRWTEVSL